MIRINSFVRNFGGLNLSQRRNAGGFLVKNIRAEENAGLREGAYRTFEFNQNNLMQIALGLIIPSIVFYNVVIDELVRKY